MTGTTTVKALAVPPNTLALEGIGTALYALSFDPSRPFFAHLLTNAPQRYEVSSIAIRSRWSRTWGSLVCSSSLFQSPTFDSRRPPSLLGSL